MSVGVYKLFVTARYEDVQKKLTTFRMIFHGTICKRGSDFLTLDRVGGPLGVSAISYPLKRIQVKI